ncbi:MAG: NUDIX hydrolase [Woeseiaceae bacterium]
MNKTGLSLAPLLLLLLGSAQAELPDGFWGIEQTRPILDATQRVHLAPDLSHLTPTERLALDELLAAGRIMNTLYERQKHRGAAAAKAALLEIHDASGGSAETSNLLDIYYLSKGPVATSLDNERGPILPTDEEQPGKNVYPFGLTREEIDAFLAAHPEKAAEIKDVRSVVRRASKENLGADIEKLNANPAIDVLHEGLRDRLVAAEYDDSALYAVPYALAFADELGKVREHLQAAAAHIAAESPDFAAYLRNKARDLLSGDYESGDASWVTGDFANLNIQIGSYETYDDALLGVKAFFSASILARDDAKSEALVGAIAGLQTIENSLPYNNHKTVRSRIPVGVYSVIADFGQARGSNTATILPNEAAHARKYGRTILIRSNILSNIVLFDNTKKKYDAAVADRFQAHLTSDGKFNRTLWHEVGHYLGPSVTADGEDFGEALGDYASLIEEMKSDLVSLFAAPALHATGYHDDDGLRSHYADGIRRTLQQVQPRPEQPYQNMQLIQFNFFMEKGLLELNPSSAQLVINYDRYHDVVTEMLEQVMHVQYSGDYELAAQFVNRWNYWDEKLHGELARMIRESGIFRRTIVRYQALEG